MIGTITFDKSSKSMKLFFYSIYIIGKYGKDFSIRRNFFNPCFIQKMAEFEQTKAYKKNKAGVDAERRTLFNKSLYAQYYGFIERKKDKGGNEILALTERGKIIYELIECDEQAHTCKLKDGALTLFQDLIWDSILFDTFGKRNDGAQESQTDIDAPKVIFRTIFDLGFATNEEIFYVLFCLNRGDSGTLEINSSYEDLLEKIKENRNNGIYDYSTFFENNGLTNKVDDSKVIDILSDPCISILVKNEQNGISFNYLSPTCQRFINDKNKFNCWSVPHSFIIHARNVKKVVAWLNKTILNKSKNSKRCTWINASEYDISQFRKEIVRNVNLAYKVKHRTNQNKTQDVYMVTICSSENELDSYLGPFIDSLKRINDYTSPRHGESESFVSDDTIGVENICFPSNFHFISIINNQYGRY